jgi:RNA polymerase sigma factor (sigma-70 family)
MSEAAVPRGLGLPVGPAQLLSDEGLARRAKLGDERAFAAIFRRYHQDLYRYCVAIVGDSEDAQDALQNAMVKVMRALPGEQRHIELKPWLYRIAHNEAIELLRRRAPTEQLDPELTAAGPGPGEEAEQRVRLRRLVADMEELPERQRGALVMRELAGLEFEQIGAALGTSPAVARQTLYEARLSLRQMEEGRELSCDDVMRALSDADGRVTRRRDIRAHLRECAGCREFRDELRRRRADFAAIAPLPAVAAAGILHGVAASGSGGGAAAGAAGGAAAGKAVGSSVLGASVLAKSAATVAVVAAIGVTAADQGGLIDVGLPGTSGSREVPAGSNEPHPSAAGSENVTGTGAGRSGGSGEPGEPARGPDAGNGPHIPATSIPAAPSPAAGPAPSAPPGASEAHRQDGAGHQANPAGAAAHGHETAAGHKGGGGAPAHGHDSRTPGNGAGQDAAHGSGPANGNAHADPPNEPPATQPQAQESPSIPEVPVKPTGPPGPEPAGGGQPAPPSESPAGPDFAPPGLR